jgi:anthranilate/para-aminobenzoate synthase component I
VKVGGLEGERDFALLGPGFFEDGHWRLFRPGDGAARLWLAQYDGAPRALSGELSTVVPELVEPPPWLSAELDSGGFEARVATIRERIAAGDVYQVNLTLRALVSSTAGSGLLSALCRRAVPRFASWVRLQGLGEFVSASPELLVETRGQWIHAEPMKGTAAPGERARLEASEKDRAELAMITDLLRNDLHQLCVRGSVNVPAERRFLELPYVIQAVSDVEGTLRDGLELQDVLQVMHPGGSVTGAPRQAAMAIIRTVEPTPRRFYCGALGIEAGGSARVSLLIRTATRLHGDAWEYGTGGGITWDSDPAAELEEVRLKLGALFSGDAPAPRR